MRKPFDLQSFWRHPSARLAFADLAPGMLAMAAWGCVTGVAMVESGLTAWQAVGMTLIVFAGTAQLASLPLIAMAAPFWLIWVSALVINLRFVIYALGQRDWLAGLSASRRFLHGAFTTDIVAASVNRRLASPPDGFEPVAYFRMGSLMSWVSWQASSVLGIWLAGQLPPGLGLAFLAALAILAMLLPMIKDRAGLACVMAAAVTSMLARGLPLNLGLLLSIVAGLLAAVMVRQCFKDRAAHSTGGQT
ncbi:MAG: AzlC family ABC transporter permease [Burkholderiaceae bacterium]